MVFDGVRVINAENPDLESYFACEGVEGVAMGGDLQKSLFNFYFSMHGFHSQFIYIWETFIT